MIFHSTLGKEFLFYGCLEDKFKLDNYVWTITNSTGRIFCPNLSQGEDIKKEFSPLPLAIVKVELDSTPKYYVIDTETKHTWLTIGLKPDGTHILIQYTPPPCLPEVSKINTNIFDIWEDSFDSREV